MSAALPDPVRINTPQQIAGMTTLVVTPLLCALGGAFQHTANVGLGDDFQVRRFRQGIAPESVSVIIAQSP